MNLTVIGGGPAGLSAAHEALRLGASTVVIEKEPVVGGLARTVEHDGHRFDIGPHRFFTTNDEVRDLFIDVAGEDLLRVPRMTRIRHGERWFDYPLTPVGAAFGLGPVESARILSSYAAARSRRMLKPAEPVTFEDWTVDAFGRRLFETFFEGYTEKVWGISCREISADWAAQRIKGLSLVTAVANALGSRAGKVKTLADEFLYLRRGAGSLYERMSDRILAGGGEVHLASTVETIEHDDRSAKAVTWRGGDGQRETRHVEALLSSAPLTELLAMMRPAPPADVLDACRGLRYRAHLAVNLIVEGNPFPDNWIYVHSPGVRAARIANYRNFSPEMAAGPGTSPLTVEYFCFPGDETWRMDDEALLALASRELVHMGLHGVGERQVARGFVLRSPQAYPVIETGHDARVGRIREWLSRFDNLLPIGRAGMFKYNNQDHAIATGLLAARTVLGHGRFDPWQVNIDASYLEAAPAR